jgi:hypothetical protein
MRELEEIERRQMATQLALVCEDWELKELLEASYLYEPGVNAYRLTTQELISMVFDRLTDEYLTLSDEELYQNFQEYKESL